MKRTLSYTITAEEHGQTILEFLRSRHYSAPVLVQLKKTKSGILRNNAWATVREVLCTADVLTIHILESAGSPNIIPSPLPLFVVYEDEDILVLNKPAGMPVHPSQGNYDNTLANAVCHYFGQQNIPYVFRCITRLDRDTTGLLLLAKHMYSASLLSRALKLGDIQREYLAVATGITPDEGRICAPIGRASGSTIERCVDEDHGDFAVTHYNCIHRENNYSLLSLSLETGRTHQIRVHLNHIGHPIPGDFLYHPDRSVIGRQALHSHSLHLYHPIKGSPLAFRAPLPFDMMQFFPSFDNISPF